MTPEAKEFHRQWAAAYKAISPDYLSGLEDAARMVCALCGSKSGNPFKFELGGWFHRDADGNLVSCEAHAIREQLAGAGEPCPLPRIDWPNMKFDSMQASNRGCEKHPLPLWKCADCMADALHAAALQRLLKCAQDVVWFDWSDNDPDAVTAMQRLRDCVNGHAVACPTCGGEGDGCNDPYHTKPLVRVSPK